MLNRLILKVIKFQLPPPKRLGTVVKNILGGHHGPPCQIGLTLLEPGGFKHFPVLLSITSPIKTPGFSNFITLNFFLFYILCASSRAISFLEPE